MTHEELERMFAEVTAAQSMLLAAVIRPFIENGTISEAALAASLAEKERAAMERGTSETAALTALIDLLRRDLGLSARSCPVVS